MTASHTIELELPPAHVATLQQIHRDLATSQDSEAFTQRALDALCALIQPAAAYVLQLNHDSTTLSVAAAWPTAVEDRAVSIPTDRLRPLDTSRAIMLEPHEQAALTPHLAVLAPAEIAALLSIPLVREAQVLGALLLAPSASRQLAPEDVLLAELISSALAGAAYGGRLAETLTRRNEQLTMVADIAAHVSSSLETREVYRLVVQKLNEYFKVEAGSLLLHDEATDELIFVMTLEGGEEKLFGMRLPPDAGVAGHVAQTQQVYITNDAENDPRHYKLSGEGTEFITRNILCAPMVIKDGTIGVIELINKQDGSFTEQEAQRLAAIANIIGVAIENARLFEFVRQRRERLERLLDRMIQGTPQDKVVEELVRELATQDSLLLVKFANPYIVGQPIRKPEMVFGRDALFTRILSVLHQNSLLLYGERRIGKTTVLLQLELRLHAADDAEYRFRPVYIDLQGIEEASFFHHMMEEILQRFGKRAKGLTLSFTPTRATYSGREFQRDLRTVIKTLCGPQPDGRTERVVLLIDEADVMYTYNERALQEFRRIFMNDYAAYLTCVFAAVHIQRHWKRYESPLYNLFQQIELPPLARADTELLARTPVRGRYEYDEDAINLIYQLSKGRPMKIQLLCLEAVNYIREQGRKNVTRTDIERVADTVKGHDEWL
ncbi:MAG: GAF domain-containing protein [Chloroflexota bacterium]|nr:GAF domain-containing protein [Chloroflexota bacterium]